MNESLAAGVPAEMPPAAGSSGAIPSGAGGAPGAFADPRVLQILTTEHWSLLSARSLVYNEAFSRAAMFLTFLSMSFVALGLVGPAMSFTRQFLLLAAVILFFDLVIGIGTLGRLVNVDAEDFRAIAAMNRIRHGYVEMAPVVGEYLSTSIHDDLRGVMATYGASDIHLGLAAMPYLNTTTTGMVGTTVSLVAGVLAGVLVLAITGSPPAAGVGATLAAVALYAVLGRYVRRSLMKHGASLTPRFPSSDAHRGS
jgi:hypothetical protein